MNEENEQAGGTATSILSLWRARAHGIESFGQSCAVHYLITAAITSRPVACPQICNQRRRGADLGMPKFRLAIESVRGPKSHSLFKPVRT
jgi:hypothetical protein